MWKSNSGTLIPDHDLEPPDDGGFCQVCHCKCDDEICDKCYDAQEVECEICNLLHHPDEPCDHDGQGVYGGPDRP